MVSFVSEATPKGQNAGGNPRQMRLRAVDVRSSALRVSAIKRCSYDAPVAVFLELKMKLPASGTTMLALPANGPEERTTATTTFRIEMAQS